MFHNIININQKNRCKLKRIICKFTTQAIAGMLGIRMLKCLHVNLRIAMCWTSKQFHPVTQGRRYVRRKKKTKKSLSWFAMADILVIGSERLQEVRWRNSSRRLLLCNDQAKTFQSIFLGSLPRSKGVNWAKFTFWFGSRSEAVTKAPKIFLGTASRTILFHY